MTVLVVAGAIVRRIITVDRIIDRLCFVSANQFRPGLKI